jgi:ATP-dependent DNA helicase RecQ
VKAVEELTDFLGGLGIEAAGYHGRMTAKRRAEAQDRFMAGRLKVLVATNAFGLGIDKPDIRFVLHHHLPGTPEAYYQELGRAGRDGQPAHCALLYDPADRKLQTFFTAGGPAEEDLVNAYHTLQRFARRPQPPTAAELEAASPLKKGRMRMCLALLTGRGIVRREARNRYRLLLPDLDRDALVRADQSHREHRERELVKLQQMVGYAEGHACRWKALLDNFGSDELPEGRCGGCDCCGPAEWA